MMQALYTLAKYKKSNKNNNQHATADNDNINSKFRQKAHTELTMNYINKKNISDCTLINNTITHNKPTVSNRGIVNPIASNNIAQTNNRAATRRDMLNSQNIKLSCIVPTHNEEDVIVDFITELYNQTGKWSHDLEIIVVDDGSQDNTIEKLNLLASIYPLKIITFSRNFGKEGALTAGLKYCTGDVAVLIDADFQHPISTIKKFLDQWANGYDMVYGTRTSRSTESLIIKKIKGVFYKLFNKFVTIKIPHGAGDFRLIDRKAIDALNNCQESGRFMKGLYSWVGFKSKEVPFEVATRKAGNTSFNFKNLLTLAITGLTAFSDLPLRLLGMLGLILSSVSFILACTILTERFIFGIHIGAPEITTVIATFFGGIQLLSVGVLGEYISKIFNEVKRRPQYIIDQTIGFES